MKGDLYYLTVCSFLVVVFGTSVYLSLKGHTLAKYFLWGWALLLVAATPFISFIPETIASYAAGFGLVFFVYVIVLFNKRNQHQLDVAQEEIQRLLAESNKRMDEERRRIARQLHDEVNPRLVLARMELDVLLPLVEKLTDGEDRQRARAIIERTLESLGKAYQDSREIIKNTRIEVIDSIGLVAALESLVSHYKSILQRPKVSFKHNLPKRLDLPPEAAVNVYRVIQEALLNAVKHAEAGNITINVSRTGGRVDVVIADDGVGISAKNAHGIGLIDMRERAKMINSELKIGNIRGHGTEISFSFSPLDSSSQT